MANPRSRSELFRRLFILCGSVALLGAVIATFAFYSYRAALTTDGLAAELTAQAHAIAGIADLMQMQTEKYAHLRTPRKAGIS